MLPPNKKQGNQQLREERLRRHWSQQALADRLGTTVTSVKRWERGATTPSAYFRVKLLALFEKSAQELGLQEEELSQEQAQETQAAETDDAPPLPIDHRVNGASSSDDPTVSRETFPDSPIVSAPGEIAATVSRSPSVSSALRDKNQTRMIELVETIWIHGMLEQSLYGATLQTLGLYELPDAVANPWRLQLQELERPTQLLPPGTSIAQIYDATNGLLLILGDPGAGKTTLLLDLARTLLARARQDPRQPIPVVFHLSSWARKRLPLEAWLVEELQQKYQVPRLLATQWIATDAIIPLLDGLDEVAIQQRTACVEALNRYRQQYGLAPIVICSRHADYLAQRGRLLLRSAVLVQPLTAAQIQDYLASFGEHVEGLRLAFHDDGALQALATTPLMLNIVTLTYYGLPRDEVLTLQSQQDRRHHIFARYVARMLRRRRVPRSATSQQVIARLAWLARQLTAHQETEFHLEDLQFDWLSPGWVRRSLPGVSMGCLQGLLIGLIFAVFFGLYYSVRSALIVGCAVGIWNAGLSCLFNEVSLGLDSQNGDDTAKRFLQRICANKFLNSLCTGLLFGILNSLFVSLLLGFLNDIHKSVVEQINYGLLYGFLIGCASSVLESTPRTIHPAETMNWSWSMFQKNAGRYAAIGVAIGCIQGFIYPATLRIALMVVTGFSALLIAGLSHSVVERYQRIRPNQGIWRSFRHAWQVGLVSGLYTCLILAGVYGYFFGPTTGLLYGIVPGVSVCLCLAFQRGGSAFLLHMILRGMVWWEGALPGDVSRFLDDAADRVLLRKVGGGYIFVHRSLLEYFASLDTASSKHIPENVRVSRRWILSGFATLATGGALALFPLLDLIPRVAGAVVYVYVEHLAPVNSIAITPNSRLVASGSDDATVRIWEAMTGVDHLVLHEDAPVTTVAWSPDGILLVIGKKNGLVQVWNVAKKKLLLTYKEHVHDGAIHQIQWSSDGQTLASASEEGVLRLWKLTGGETIAVLQALSGSLGDMMTWSPDGVHLAFIESKQRIQMWNLPQRRQIVTITTPKRVSGIAWSPDGTSLASCASDGTLQIWKLSKLPSAFTFAQQFPGVRCLCWSPDGRYLLTGGNQEIQVWESRQGNLILHYFDLGRNHHVDPRGTVTAVAWSPDGAFLASAVPDTTVRLWKAPTL